MDTATSEAPPPTEQQIEDATQALLSRNATIIHTLIREYACRYAVQGPDACACSHAAAITCCPRACDDGSEHAARLHRLHSGLSITHLCILSELSRRRGAEPMPCEATLAAEAYDNLAAVALTFSPAELAAPPAPPLAAGVAAPVQPVAQLPKPPFSAAVAARSLGLLPQAPPPTATRAAPVAALQQRPASGGRQPSATAAATGAQRSQAAAGGLYPPPRQLAAMVAHPQPLQRLPSRDAHPSEDHRLVCCRAASQNLMHGTRVPRLPHPSHGC